MLPAPIPVMPRVPTLATEPGSLVAVQTWPASPFHFVLLWDTNTVSVSACNNKSLGLCFHEPPMRVYCMQLFG